LLHAKSRKSHAAAFRRSPNKNNARMSSGCVTIGAAGTRNQGWN
jgi:hypothetical protein